MSATDVCIKCGESRGAIRSEELICWDGYDPLGKHRFRPWPTEFRKRQLMVTSLSRSLTEPERAELAGILLSPTANHSEQALIMGKDPK